MCEGPFLNAAQRDNGSYDFYETFSGIKDVLSDSDFVIGNLETPLAGENAGYTKTKELYSFNTPYEFALAIKRAGIDLVLTANNHCCDRGIDGLIQTLDVLNKCGLDHTGTYQFAEEGEPYYFKIEDTTIAIISCTSSTNAALTKIAPDILNVHLLDEQILYPQTNYGSIRKMKWYIVNKILGIRCYIKIRKILGKSPLNPTVDDDLDMKRMTPYISRLKDIIAVAEKKADIVFVCPHMGGQFNKNPGRFSRFVMEDLSKTGVNAIVASHPHIVQRVELMNGKPCFYSIGNVSMSMGTEYVIRDNLPDYGLIIHFYIDKKKIKYVSYTIIKMIEDESGYIRVKPMDELLNQAEKFERTKLESDIQYIKKRLQAEDISKISDNGKEIFLHF